MFGPELPQAERPESDAAPERELGQPIDQADRRAAAVIRRRAALRCVKPSQTGPPRVCLQEST